MNYKRPEIFMPFNTGINAAIERVIGPTWAWIDKWGLAPNEAARARWRRTRPELPAALYYPTADVEALVVMSHAMVLAFLVDDQLDDGPSGRSVVRCDAAINSVLDVFEGGEATNRMTRAFADWWQRILPGRSAGWRRAYVDNYRRYLQAYLTESMDRRSGRILGLDEYVIHRRESTAMFPFFDLCEVPLGMNLPDAVRCCPTYIELRDAANDYCGLLNDLYSVEKDHITGYMHSAVLVLEHTEGCSPQEAADRVNDIITACVRRFIAAEERLDADLQAIGVDPATRADAVRCARSYRAPMWGTYEYHRMSERYHRVSLPSPGAPGGVTDYAREDLFANLSSPRTGPDDTVSP